MCFFCQCDQAQISLVDKELLRVTLQSIYDNTIKAFNKSIETVRVAEATAAISELAVQAKEQNKDVVVTNMDFGSDSKVVKKIQDLFKSVYPECSLFMLSLDAENDSWGIYVYIAAKQQQGEVSAKAWVQHCLAGAGGGKGGGKVDTATASIPTSVMSEPQGIMQIAQEYAASNSLSF